MSSSRSHRDYLSQLPHSRSQRPVSNEQADRQVAPATNEPSTTQTARDVPSSSPAPSESPELSDPPSSPSPSPEMQSTKSPKMAAWVEPPVEESHMDFENRPTVAQREWTGKVRRESENGAFSEALIKRMLNLFPDKISGV